MLIIHVDSEDEGSDVISSPPRPVASIDSIAENADLLVNLFNLSNSRFSGLILLKLVIY